MKKVAILINACCYNRGSEALVVGTAEIVKKYIPDSSILLSGAQEEFSDALAYPGIDRYVRRYTFYRRSLPWLLYTVLKRVFRQNGPAESVKVSGLLKACADADLIIVIAGDNYDKSYHLYPFMHTVNDLLKQKTHAKLLLYDCSLAEDEIDEPVKRDFALFDALTAREQTTYQALLRNMEAQSLYYYPDPAFVMGKQEIELPPGYFQRPTVGINLSSLVLGKQYGDNAGVIFIAYIRLIEHILANTTYDVLLIPHVMRGKDLQVLTRLYQAFPNEPRVILVDNEAYKAPEVKYLISRCRLFVGARTHATIAAYSSCVPTLVLGYSVKSIGIARDLFGTEKGYVLAAQSLLDEQALTAAFIHIDENQASIRDHLQAIMPEYIDAAWSAGQLFNSLTEGHA